MILEDRVSFLEKQVADIKRQLESQPEAINLDLKLEQIANLVIGLKYYEWCKIRTAIEKRFDSIRVKSVLSDIESLKTLLRNELN
jgi:hypothetical protein